MHSSVVYHMQDDRRPAYQLSKLWNMLHLRAWKSDPLRRKPEVNLLSAFPKNYSRRIKMATGPSPAKFTENQTEPRGPPEFRTRLDLAETATVVYPLSEKMIVLLAQYSKVWLDDDSINANKSLILSLKYLLWDLPKLWANPVRGMVVKCNEDIAAKVMTGN